MGKAVFLIYSADTKLFVPFIPASSAMYGGNPIEYEVTLVLYGL